MIFTIGYQCITPAELLKAVLLLDATLIDVRFRPVSRKPGFGFRQIEALLPEGRYILGGHFLGGRGNVTAKGLRSLEQFEGESNCLLMCLENHPEDCHRHTDITGAHYPEAQHILDGNVFRSGDLQDAIDGHRSYQSIESYRLEA